LIDQVFDRDSLLEGLLAKPLIGGLADADVDVMLRFLT